jgi:GWxTD domain-containing protein
VGGLTTVLEDTLPVLGPGVYQIAVAVQLPVGEREGEEEAVLTTGRFIVLMHPGFPRPVTIEDLIEPLAYITNQNEFRELSAPGSPEERRKRFEDFWLGLAGDQQAAGRLIKKYYSGVEEANKQFSAVKEGWKTDRGMLYVVLGPPDRVDRLFDKMTWYYSLRGSQVENTYGFRRVLFAPENFQLEDYYLLRGQVYEIFWQRMVARWRDGEIY